MTTQSRKSFSSRFKEHLSLSFPIEISHFSPDSPSDVGAASSTFAGSFSNNIPRDVESPTTRSNRETIRDRFTKMFFDIRTLDDRNKEADIVPIQSPLPEWLPLHVEKKHSSVHLVVPKKNEKPRRKYWIIALLILLAYLVGNVIFLNVRVAALTKSSTVATSTSHQSLSSSAIQCISQFTLNAPSNPSSYPCGSCLSALSGVTPNVSTQDFQQATKAIQFCGLVAIFGSANSAGQSALMTGGWLKDLNFCAWSGVSCDNSSQVSSLELTFPGVPAALPTELGGLAGMQSLQIIGNGAVPAGSMPLSFLNLTSLTTFHLESTSISTFPNNLFSAVNKVSNLTFISNLKLAANLTSITQLPLQRLIIQRQFVGNPLNDLASSVVLQSSLSILDLSWNSFSGSIPSNISSLSSLTQLNLDYNNLQAPLPTSFPANLQILTLANNTALTGILPSSFCGSTKVVQCDLKNTGLSNATGCGICQF